MATISVTVHTAGVMGGWTEEDRQAVNVLSTEASLAKMLTEQIASATGLDADDITVEVRREDRGDFWRIDADDAREQLDLDEIVRDVLIDFPWHDAQRWAVFDHLTSADGQHI